MATALDPFLARFMPSLLLSRVFDVFKFPWDFLSSMVSMPILGLFCVYLLLFNLYPS